ncbi:4-oxalomesaconate tautomerase [Cupriavidus yeoncheonensis]|uniref:4-oxalomesaconate tautomerase n=1 Tax=Cupriavidus yeoncheonensis TaxID=1462994 RepID=A0A916IXY4_9BURK|nr:PrpF domain-containing protein [Cupriavidus yeoncheonensis]CAG2151360.1 4-oxalomesaconate tautomerase [Cupriavidus yeoncheonensis]
MIDLQPPRLRHDTWEFPVHHMRGGTSTGLVIWDRIAPTQPELREELLRHLMGVPLRGEYPGNRQTTGLGRGPATSNKVFFADMEDAADGRRLVSALAQLASDHGRIDWSVNCGNMSSALQLWALDTGLARRSTTGLQTLTIRNTNTGVLTTSRMIIAQDGGFEVAEIPGVMGRHPAVDLFLHHPAGAKTGALLPTGNVVDVIDDLCVSCVDVAVPMVIARAADFGKTGHEPPGELAADKEFLQRLKALWIEAGLRMNLRRKDGSLMTREDIARSETIPKVCIIGAPRGTGDLSVRYFTPQTVHGSMAVSGGCCLAAATLIPGSVAHEIAPKQAQAKECEVRVGIENPAGVLGTTVVAHMEDGALAIRSAAYQRSAQVLLAGYMPLYGASTSLRQALSELQ